MNQLQAVVLKAILKKESYDILRGITTPEMFDDSTAKQLLQIIDRMQGGTSEDIDETALEIDIEASIPTNLSLKDELLSGVQEIRIAEEQNPYALKRSVKRFVSRAKSFDAMEYIGSHINDDDFDPTPAYKALDDAMNASVILDIDVTSYKDARPSDEPSRSGVIGLGVSDKLDKALDGGLANGELGLYIAAAGVGKTSFLWASTAYAASQGRHCLGISLEINKNKCVQRVDQWFTGLDKHGLISNPSQINERRAEIGDRIQFQDWTAKKPTVEDIRALVIQMRQIGIPIDYLMVDYLELVRPEYYNPRHPRFNYSAVAKDMRAMAKELDIVCLSAWQTNRAAANKIYLDKTDVGEDWGIVKVVDSAYGLNQSSEELKSKVMRVNILKQRESTNRCAVRLKCDLDRMIIKEEADDG